MRNLENQADKKVPCEIAYSQQAGLYDCEYEGEARQAARGDFLYRGAGAQADRKAVGAE